MLEVVRHRGPDGLHVATRGAVGLGHARLVLREPETRRMQPFWSPDESCAIVADVRLYNRRELLSALGKIAWADQPPCDAEVVLAAYERWQIRAIDRLRGDFAIVIWDLRRRTVLAARDPFGIKPLFYAAERHRISFGSEAKQLVVAGGIEPAPNNAAVARLLVETWPKAREDTFFAGVKRLLPGHWLEAKESGLRVQRWWNPEPRSIGLPHPEREVPGRFLELFRNSVLQRLEADHPVALELSGGLDSSSIVAVAGQLYNANRETLPQIVTVSQLYPRLSCSEDEFIAAVRESSPFASISYDAPVDDYTPRLDEELLKADAPYPETAWLRREAGASRLASRGCRILVTGLGGDELTWDPDYEIDLWREGRYLTALRYCLTDPRPGRAGMRMESLWRLARLATPSVLRRGLRRWFPRDAVQRRPWLTPHAIELASDETGGPPVLPRFPSIAQSAIYRWLNSPSFHWVLESEELLSSYHGLELRHPFLDRDLAEFVLSVPYRARIALPGSFKTLLVAAMQGLLPRMLMDRAGKATFEEYFDALDIASQSQLDLRLFGAGPWSSGHLVSRRELEASFRRAALSPRASWSAHPGLWVALMAEAWLRQLSGDGV